MSKHINKIFSMIQTELKSEKVELALVDDYNKRIDKANEARKEASINLNRTEIKIGNAITQLELALKEGNKIEKVELEKVELGAIDDLRNDYKKAASKAVPLKKIILKAASDLDQISNELDKVQANAKKLEGMAKELGADSIVKSAKALFDSSGNLSSEWGKSAIKISTAAKNI